MNLNCDKENINVTQVKIPILKPKNRKNEYLCLLRLFPMISKRLKIFLKNEAYVILFLNDVILFLNKAKYYFLKFVLIIFK